MPVPESGQLSFPVLRQEGHKTSWLTPNYPTIGTLYETGRDFVIQADVNHMVGNGLDAGEGFDFKQCYGWDTWKKPTMLWAYVQQFSEDGGIRVVWKVQGGDPWRTAWSIRFLNDNYPTAAVGSDSGYDGQYGPEHNTGSSDPSLQYSTDRKIQAMQDSVNWDDVATWGDYHLNNADPTPGGMIDPIAVPQPDGVMFSYIITNDQGLDVDGSTRHYVSIVPVDGRQFDTLSNANSPSSYSLDRAHTDYSAGVKADAGKGTNWNYYDSISNGGLILYDNIGGATISSITNSGFTSRVDNVYKHYLGGQSLYYWVYVTAELGTLDQPHWPSDGGDYDGPSGEDNYTDFDFDKWVRYEGDESIISGVLSADTEYRVYISSYQQNDIQRYDNAIPPISAPAEDRGYVAFDDTKSGSEDHVIQANDNIRTTATSISEPSLGGTEVVAEWNSASVYLEFDYNGNEDGIRVYYKIDGGPQHQGDIGGSQNCIANVGTSNNPKKVRFSMDEVQPQGTTVEVAVQMTSTTEGDSLVSNYVTATEVGFSDIPTCPI